MFLQVIDEQFLVECFPGNPEGLVSYQKRKQQAGGRRRPGSSSSSNSGGAGVVRDVIVTSKFRGRQFRKDDSGEEERIDDAATHRYAH